MGGGNKSNESSPKNSTATMSRTSSQEDLAAKSPKSPTWTTSPPTSPNGTPKPTVAATRFPNFLPARSRFKWRKHPIPSQFLGVKDHADLRHVKEQCVFLNMSTTEVLCTTSAEALAMGKYVILPKHPSNEFFFSFPNCLIYETLEECVFQLLYAMEHDPTPLSAEHRRALSWEGATTERLYQAAAITKGQVQQREKLGLYQEQQKAARTHVDMARKSQFVSELFSGKVLKKLSSMPSSSAGSTSSTPPSPTAETVKTTETASTP